MRVKAALTCNTKTVSSNVALTIDLFTALHIDSQT